MMAGSTYERRNHGRISFKGNAAYCTPERPDVPGARIMSAPVIDISETGALLMLNHVSGQGEILKVSFKLGGRISSSICCQVVGVRETQDGYLTGIEFIVLKESDGNAIREIVNKDNH